MIDILGAMEVEVGPDNDGLPSLPCCSVVAVYPAADHPGNTLILQSGCRRLRYQLSRIQIEGRCLITE